MESNRERIEMTVAYGSFNIAHSPGFGAQVKLLDGFQILKLTDNGGTRTVHTEPPSDCSPFDTPEAAKVSAIERGKAWIDEHESKSD